MAVGISKGREVQAKIDADLPTDGVKIIGKNYFRNPSVNQGFYSKKRDGVADPDPKVMEPYQAIPGKPPRKVVIDRQRKLFASLDIEELLLELGIDYRNPHPNPADWLPLEPFDDLEYDCRLPHEWIDMGYDENGKFAPIPAQGLCKYEDGSAEWKPVLIESWDEERSVYCGQWDMSSEYVELTRINLLFNSEDPRIFAQRVAQAHQERIYADSQIRYNFFIDNMPTEELPEIDQEQSMRIFRMATDSRYLKSRTNVETAGIIFEVNQDYFRTMNKIIMDQTLASGEQDGMIPANLTLPEKPRAKEVAYYGMVPIPPHDFPDAFSNFCFRSLYIKEESIRAMVEIRTECNQLMKENRIFAVSASKTMLRVDEFKTLQQNAIGTMAQACGDGGWVGRLVKIIKTQFEDVGKGWFNIHETSKPTYEFGKLKKFLTLVNFMMQDTVLNICKDSVKDFVEFITSYCPLKTEIRNTHDVVNYFDKKLITAEDSDYEEEPFKDIPADQLDDVQRTLKWLHKEFDKNKDPDPLFVIDLIVNNDSPIPKYTTPLEEITARILEVFDKGLKILGEIPQLEPVLLRRLFKNQNKFVKAPQRPLQEPGPPDPEKKALPDEDAWLWWAYKDIETALNKAIEPLYEYVQTFKQFEPEHQLNADRYIKAIEDPPEGQERWDAEMLRADILKHKELEADLRRRIPESVKVSIFNVIIKDIRMNYSSRYQQIIDKEIKLIAQLAIDQNYEINKKFEAINDKIQRPPADIEELMDIKKEIMDAGAVIEKLQADIDGCMRCYDVAAEFDHEFTTGQNDQKWNLYGSPQRTMQIIEAQASVLEKQKEVFIKEMEAEQEQFKSTLELLKGNVDTFGGNFDKLDQYADAAEAVEFINQRLATCLEESKKFNLRENLCGLPITDYSIVQQTQKAFQPFSNLWLTARTWFQRSVAWKDGAWDELDAEELDTTFENLLKTSGATARFFG